MFPTTPLPDSSRDSNLYPELNEGEDIIISMLHKGQFFSHTGKELVGFYWTTGPVYQDGVRVRYSWRRSMRQRNFWTSTVRGLKKFSLDFACFISLAQGQREMPHPLGRSQHEVWNVPNHKENFDKNVQMTFSNDVQMILAAWSYTYWQVPRFNSKNWLKLSFHVPGFYGKF